VAAREKRAKEEATARQKEFCAMQNRISFGSRMYNNPLAFQHQGAGTAMFLPEQVCFSFYLKSGNVNTRIFTF
jgi:hypothetical protein